MNDISICLTTGKQYADAIKKAGFKYIMVSYTHEADPKEELESIKYAQSIGLKVILGHLLYSGINNLWLDNEDGEKLIATLKEDIKTLASLGIPELCMHLTSKFVAPEPNELGLKRIKGLNECAKENGVKLSLENTKIKGYQEYVMSNIKDENLGICIDIGHAHCHFHDDYDIDLFKDKIFSLHLHDNDESDDQHLFPYEGTIDWPKLFNTLKRNNYQGYINLELSFKNYKDMPIDEFYTKAYECALKLKELA